MQSFVKNPFLSLSNNEKTNLAKATKDDILDASSLSLLLLLNIIELYILSLSSSLKPSCESLIFLNNKYLAYLLINLKSLESSGLGVLYPGRLIPAFFNALKLYFSINFILLFWSSSSCFIICLIIISNSSGVFASIKSHK